ncbi:hypothetical protein M0R45_034914 [Rubus argutus]|uniref:TIR domain-containing protein n=1 Tax=Rubus argutus TaxID=59490 RepID=A0AAW1VUK0_RUBAR
MRLFQCLFFLLIFFFKGCNTTNTSHEPCYCHDEESSALLQFKQSFTINASASGLEGAYRKVSSWKLAQGGNSTCCCDWDRVECDEETGHVIELDLKSSCLYGSINSNNSLFSLVHLQRLNLADNHFNYSHIPTTIRNFPSLTQLDLSASVFSGQVPSQLSQWVKLSSLDLSFNIDPSSDQGLLKLDGSDFRSLVQNLTRLEHLRLRFINISSTIPHSMANLSFLTTLDLHQCELFGNFPVRIFQLQSLQNIYVRDNQDLIGYLPEFNQSSPLTTLDIHGTRFFGTLPSSIGRIGSLKQLDVAACNFSEGLVPSWLGNLRQLTYLDISANKFGGLIPESFANLTKLTVFKISTSELTGPIPSWLGNFNKLIYLDFGFNRLNSSIPASFSNLTSLEILFLQNNELSGIVEFQMFEKLQNFNQLQLSFNNLEFVAESIDMNASSVPQFTLLYLNSCNIRAFPYFLRYLKSLERLDLSMNKLHGQVPKWMYNVSTETLKYFSLESNLLSGFDQLPVVLPWVNLQYFSLTNNAFQGPLPVPAASTVIYYVQGNNFTGEISPLICNINSLQALVLNDNNLSGMIPQCFRNLTSLRALDLSNNNLSGLIPQFFGNFSDNLMLLNLGNNSFNGALPQTYNNKSNLRMLDVSQNQLQGQLPRSLANCLMLETLILSNNNFNDVFPSWLRILPELRLLSMRHNGFQGVIEKPENDKQFPKLRILDISHNNFTGEFLVEDIFSEYAMRPNITVNQSTYIRVTISYIPTSSVTSDISTISAMSYISTSTFNITFAITSKGVDRHYSKIQEAFAVIDISSNKFVGKIDGWIGNLKGLHSLNVSNNLLTGAIPSSLGNLMQLESLDLSNNKLSGEIPQQLAQLTSLAEFNVSHNNLTGPIPRGTQLMGLDITSYQGNSKLCGTPLPKKCENSNTLTQLPPSSTEENDLARIEFDWKFVLAGFGSGIVVGVVLADVAIIRRPELFLEVVGVLIRLIETITSWKRLRDGDVVVISQKASTSKTSPCPSKYDVFLSFRGEDTRKTFTDHLYTALTNAGFRTFRDDDELPRGENIKPELQKAIQQSQSSVIVLSENYASSGWCLDELVMILQCKATSNHVVLPVFYDIDPSHLRKQTGSLAKAFTRHQKKQSPEKLNRWREALTQVADLAGLVLQNQADRHESKFIQNIVKEIQGKLLRRLPLSDVQDVLQKKLLSVNPVLDDAEGKQLNNPTVKAWLNELQEAVYDAEDLLQEIKTEVLRPKMEPKSGISTNEVQELISSHASHAFDLALINSRVDKVSKRLDSIMTERKDILGLEANARHRVSLTIPSTPLVQESGVYGRDVEKEKFIKLLLSDDEKKSVIPIVGMGGIGKTTLAQLLYNDVRVKQHFDIQAWACVSNEFDVIRISQRIYESLNSDACKTDQLQLKLKEALAGRKFFIVLDDVWNKNYDLWDKLQCPFDFGAHGSKIIVTTRDEDVASMTVTPQHQPHCLMELSDENGWLLFEKHAFKSRGVGAHSDLEVIGRQIVTKCNGLPLALTCLGGLLCSKLTVREWKSILNSEMWELPQKESNILPSLWLSYMSLPPYLKRCFAYCSIFPKNYKFQTSELVFLWKAEDLLQPQKEKMAVEIGNDYFNELISRSFFQLSSSYSYPQDYIMHDLINDLASFVSGEFCFRWENSDPNILRKTRHFSYMIKYDDDDDDDEKKFEALQQAKCLRTFLPLAPKRLKLLSKGLHEVLPKLQCLRMLKLSGYNIKEWPDSINNLKHLRHLDMSYTSIKKLPDTICTLYNLQALLLLHCKDLTELPPNFGRLINLTHVDVEGTKLEKMPPHMGNLEHLQVLTAFVLDKHTAGGNLLELKKLQNLHGTIHISGLVHVSSLVAYILTDKKFLNELVLFWGDRHVGEERTALQEREVLEKFQPHLNLERLTIDGYGGKLFPGWSRYYSSSAIVCLKLYNCVNCISLPPLGQLPSLRELHISQLSGVASIGSEFYYGDNCVNKPFRSLRSLRIEFMSGWQEWSYVGDDENEGVFFPNLGELHLTECPNLTGRLALDSFPMLKEVVLNKIGFSHIAGSQECPELGILKLSNCSNIVSFPDGGLRAPNLTDIQIGFCEKLGSWPEQIHILLPSLQSLRIRGCPELECFPDGEFPSKLKSLNIEDCKKFNANSTQNMNKGLRRLTSLETLSFDFDGCEEVDSFPEEGLLPSALTHLHIYWLKLKTMDGAKWFGHLNSLITLEFRSCSELQCLPDTGLPSSLSVLQIFECDSLAQWCRKQKAEDSPKIAHIRRIEIDGKLLIQD